MALAGIWVEFSKSGKRAYNAGSLAEPLQVRGKPTSSVNLTSPGVTSIAAADGDNIVHLVAVADSFVAIGPGTPNASAEPRTYCKAGVEYDLACDTNDKVAYILVP
jgi:hypothetical protein